MKNRFITHLKNLEGLQDATKRDINILEVVKGKCCKITEINQMN